MARLQGRFLAGNSVSTDKIVDDNVTFVKLDNGMVDQASGLAVLDATRKLSIERIPQALIDDVADHEARLNALEGRQTLRELVTLTQAEIDAKAFVLSEAPSTPGLTILQPVDGVVAAINIDYSISGATVSWAGLGLDNVGLVAGDQIQVWYDFASGGVAGDLAQEILDRQSADAALQLSIDTAQADADDAQARVLALENFDLDTRVTQAQADASDAQTRVGTLEGQNLDSRVTTAQNGVDTLNGKIGAPSGIAQLDSGGKVPGSQLPNTIMSYKGTWNATTNTPTLANGAIANAPEDAGNVYRCAVAGTVDFGPGPVSFDVGDYVILSAAMEWEKGDNSDAVTSVNGKQGVVTLDRADFTNVNSALTALENKLGYLPLGAVIATMPHLTGAYACTATTAADASGFVLCNGQTVADVTSPLNGQVIPQINNDVFLMGTSGVTSNTAQSANTKTLAVANIPQMSGTFTSGTVSSGHTHGFGAWSGGINANHTHSYVSPGGAGSGLFGTTTQVVPAYPQTGTVSADHAHYTSGTTNDINQNHTHNTTVTLGTASPTALDVRPKYITTKYVMRIK
jgi:hypothetical protein